MAREPNSWEGFKFDNDNNVGKVVVNDKAIVSFSQTESHFSSSIISSGTLNVLGPLTSSNDKIVISGTLKVTNRLELSDGSTLTTAPGNRVYNVIDYGAIGNGIVDDGPAIKAAISEARANGGGIVYFPGLNGTSYNIHAPIYLTSSFITLNGDGVRSKISTSSSQIIIAASPTTHLSGVYTYYVNNKISNLYLYSSASNAKVLDFSGFSYSTFEDLAIDAKANDSVCIYGRSNNGAQPYYNNFRNIYFASITSASIGIQLVNGAGGGVNANMFNDLKRLSVLGTAIDVQCGNGNMFSHINTESIYNSHFRLGYLDYPIIYGSSSAVNATTLSDDTKSWPINAYAGRYIAIVSGTALGEIQQINSNSSASIIVTSWTTQPSAKDWYQIAPYAGIVSSSTVNTMTVAGTPWVADALAGYHIYTFSGSAGKQIRRITSNTTNRLVLGRDWVINPDETTKYVIAQSAQSFITSGATGVDAWAVAIDVSSSFPLVQMANYTLRTVDNQYRYIHSSITSPSGVYLATPLANRLPQVDDPYELYALTTFGNYFSFIRTEGSSNSNFFEVHPGSLSNTLSNAYATSVGCQFRDIPRLTNNNFLFGRNMALVFTTDMTTSPHFQTGSIINLIPKQGGLYQGGYTIPAVSWGVKSITVNANKPVTSGEATITLHAWNDTFTLKLNTDFPYRTHMPGNFMSASLNKGIQYMYCTVTTNNTFAPTDAEITVLVEVAGE